MPIAINLIISGLIALVPNVADHPSELTAYLVKDSQHAQVFSVFGDDSLEPGTDGEGVPQCFKIRYGEGKVVHCDLDNTDIYITRQNERRENFFRNRPRKEAPDSPDEKSLMDWLVRMYNIERQTGHVKTWSDLKGLVGARLTFGWDTASVLELDGSEVGKSVKIGFRDSRGKAAELVQSVAESLLFRINLEPGPLAITLFNRDTHKSRTITSRCRGARCVSMELSNTYIGAEGCGDGNHFIHYYGLVRETGSQMLPYSTEERNCVAPGKEKVDLNLLRGTLELLSPLAPRESKNIFSQLPLPAVKDQEELIKLINDKFDQENKLGSSSADFKSTLVSGGISVVGSLLSHLPKVQDRIICPPVLLEP